MIRSSQHSSKQQTTSWRNALRGLVVYLGVVVVLFGGGKAWGQEALPANSLHPVLLEVGVGAD